VRFKNISVTVWEMTPSLNIDATVLPIFRDYTPLLNFSNNIYFA